MHVGTRSGELDANGARNLLLLRVPPIPTATFPSSSRGEGDLSTSSGLSLNIGTGSAARTCPCQISLRDPGLACDSCD